MKIKDIINWFCGRNKVISVGDTLSFEGTVHGSVGIGYYLEYDKDAFSEDIERKDLYTPRPKDYRRDKTTGKRYFVRPCGGDEMRKICRLTALKEGRYTIREINEFRGTIEKEVMHNIRVK